MRAALADTVKELRAQLRAGGLSEGQMALAALPEEPGAEGAEQPMSSREREDLAAQLTAGEGDRRLIDAQATPPIRSHRACVHMPPLPPLLLLMLNLVSV